MRHAIGHLDLADRDDRGLDRRLARILRCRRSIAATGMCSTAARRRTTTTRCATDEAAIDLDRPRDPVLHQHDDPRSRGSSPRGDSCWMCRKRVLRDDGDARLAVAPTWRNHSRPRSALKSAITTTPTIATRTCRSFIDADRSGPTGIGPMLVARSAAPRDACRASHARQVAGGATRGVHEAAHEREHDGRDEGVEQRRPGDDATTCVDAISASVPARIAIPTKISPPISPPRPPEHAAAATARANAAPPARRR